MACWRLPMLIEQSVRAKSLLGRNFASGLGSIQFRNWNYRSIPIPIPELELELELTLVELKMELELKTLELELELELKTWIEFFATVRAALTS